jgi:hypothetical protein
MCPSQKTNSPQERKRRKKKGNFKITTVREDKANWHSAAPDNVEKLPCH